MLTLNNIHKTFMLDNNPKNDRYALKGINLTINDGDFVTIIGSNGSGKSTLLNVIAGKIAPDLGEITLDDINLLKLKEHKRAAYISRVFQDPKQGSVGEMSLSQNLALAFSRGKHLNLKWSDSRKKREDYKKMLAPLGLGLENRLDERMEAFSGGERQSVTLLMATFNNPKLILLDEHTAALDPKTAKTVMDFTEKIVDEMRVTTIMVTHNMKDAIRYGNRLIMMDEGKIIFEASGEEKKRLTVADLLEKFNSLATKEMSDTMLLA